MAREKKTRLIAELEQAFARSRYTIHTDYRGLTATQINDLRSKLGEAGVRYRVVKNTLARFAAGKAGLENAENAFKGPLAIAFGDGDISQTARFFLDYIRSNKSVMTIRGGFLESRLLTAADMETLSTLPPREVLISQVLGGMKSPVRGLVNVLSRPVGGLMGVIQARISQLEGA